MSYSSNPLISGNIHGTAKIWLVGGIFLVTGLFMAILPVLITPQPTSQTKTASGKIIDFATDSDGSTAEIFQFTTSNGQQITKQNNIWSTPPAYQLNEEIEVYYDPGQPEQISWIKGDRSLIIMNYILLVVGGYFVLFGLIIIGLQLLGVQTLQIERICGVIGALSFGIPATLALPVLYWLYQNRPNFLFTQDSIFPQESYFFGAIFSLLGLLVTVATILMVRATKNSNSNSIHFSAKL
jgi:hypothetical protein